jgi:hypothetical protein
VAPYYDVRVHVLGFALALMLRHTSSLACVARALDGRRNPDIYRRLPEADPGPEIGLAGSRVRPRERASELAPEHGHELAPEHNRSPTRKSRQFPIRANESSRESGAW